MKITFVEEIEAHKAWRECMTCPQCGEFKYRIHHQTQPESYTPWWIECCNCGYESPASPAREIAIARWKQR